MIVQLFMLLLKGATVFVRRPQWYGVSRKVIRAFGTMVTTAFRASPKESLPDIGDEWQRMFTSPGRRYLPLISSEPDTLRYAITTHCPLRGTGDVAACHRMMEYDRRLMESIGGEFVVLASQAEHGRNTCVVAIRKKGADMSDLTPAHVRVAHGLETTRTIASKSLEEVRFHRIS